MRDEIVLFYKARILEKAHLYCSIGFLPHLSQKQCVSVISPHIESNRRMELLCFLPPNPQKVVTFICRSHTPEQSETAGENDPHGTV